jgi:hypothetical protein
MENGNEPFITRMPNLLQESSLSRIFDFYKKEDFAILTSWKAKTLDGKDIKKSENKKNLFDLMYKTRRLGFGFVQVYGIGQETDPDTGDISHVKEPSILIPNRKYTQQDFNKGASNTEPKPVSFEDFRNIICDLGVLNKENPQTLVLVYNHKNTTAYLIDPVSKSVWKEASNISYNKFTEYFTALRGDYTEKRKEVLKAKGKDLATPKKFSFESIFIAKIPDSSIQAQNRMSEGELFEMCGEDNFIKKIGEMMDYMTAHPGQKSYFLK